LPLLRFSGPLEAQTYVCGFRVFSSGSGGAMNDSRYRPELPGIAVLSSRLFTWDRVEETGI
jgi:hypothetical protein